MLALTKTSSNSLVYRGWFRLYFALMIFWLAFASEASWTGFERGQVVTGRSFRFTALEDGSGSQPVGTGIASFGLLVDGCRKGFSHSNASLSDETLKVFRTRTASSNQIVAATPPPSWPKHKTTVEGAQMTLSFEAPVEMNGWFFQGIPEAPERQPVRFTIEVQGSEDDDGPWSIVGSPFWDYRADGLRVLLPHIRAKRLRDHYDMRTPSFYVFFSVFPKLMVLASFVCGLALLLCNKSVLAEAVVVTALGSVILTSFITFVLAASITSEDRLQPMLRVSGMARSARVFVSVAFVLMANFLRRNFLAHSLFFGGGTLMLEEWALGVVHRADCLKIFQDTLTGLFLMVPLVVEIFQDEVRFLKLNVVVQRGIKFWEKTWSQVEADNQGKWQDLRKTANKFVPRDRASQRRRRQMSSETSARSLSSTNMSPFDSIGVVMHGLGIQGLPDRSRPATCLDYSQLLFTQTPEP